MAPRIWRPKHYMPVVVHREGTMQVEQREASFVEIDLHLFERDSKPIVTIKPIAKEGEMIVMELQGVWHSYPRRKK